MRGFRDRDFVSTPEGFLFCVVGSTHPPDRVMAYLKYVPRASGGPWSRGSTKFHRALHEYSMEALRETLDFLRDYPAYLTYFEAFGTEMSAVPVSRIVEHYRPEERLGQMASSTWLDALEEKALSLARLISSLSDIPLLELGVTGSILLGIHVPGVSDIDLVVYGRGASARVREAMSKALDDRGIEVQRLEGEVARAWCARKARIYSLTLDEAKSILDRKWNVGTYEGVRFSIHPVLTEGEAEAYGERIYRPVGRVTVRAEVRDASLAMFLPAIYGVKLRRVLEGPGLRDLREICSYESLFADVAREGEEVIARGKLELVHDMRDGSKYYRVLIGSLSGQREFIKPLGPS